MAARINSEPVEASADDSAFWAASRSGPRAAAAAAQVWTAGLLLAGAGLALSVFVIARLFLTWRVGPHRASHHISLLGQRLSYPVANLDAWIVLAMAMGGLAVGALMIWGAIREFAAARAFERRLAAQARSHVKGASVIPDERPHAFCAGLMNPRVYISSGAVVLLDEAALSAVLAHEAHHARRRDPLRLAVGRVLARALFFVPALGELARRQQSLAELGADESAVDAGPDGRSGLARAMLTFSDSSPEGGSVGIDPLRVDHLLGEPPGWRFPTLLCLAAAGAIGLVAAVAILAGQLAAGSATLAPPFLSHQPCIVVLALIPAAVGLGCAGVSRSVRRSAA
jgi:Zn-dependent protease with chaperone function